MDASHLQPSSLPPLDRSYSINKLIDEDDIASYYLSSDQSPLSPSYNDDFPTPKGHLQRSHVPPPIQPTTFDELYDVSDGEDEAEHCPLTCSQSVKLSSLPSPDQSRTARTPKTPKTPKSGKRYPSLIIPSPSAWPTIEKYQRKAAAGLQPSPMPIMTPNPEALSKLVARRLQVPSRNATPSLDGSLTSDEQSEQSCPTTPATPEQQDEAGAWSAGPVQLHPDAMNTLHRLSGDDQDTPLKEVLEVSRAEAPPQEEMKQVIPDVATKATESDITLDSEPISALSIPSPGGFFSSLGDNIRDTWGQHPQQNEEPSTSTAENFYTLPWEPPGLGLTTSQETNDIIRQVVEFRSQFDTDSSAPSTARQIFTPDHGSTSRRIGSPSGELDDLAEIAVLDPGDDSNEAYFKELLDTGALSIDRTGEWLKAQMSYLSNLLQENPSGAGSPIEAHARKYSDASSGITRSKSVRFADVVPDSPPGNWKKSDSKPKKPPRDTIFFEGFNYMRDKTQKHDLWNHRRERAESLHLDRACLARSHREQLMGRFHLNAPQRPVPQRPISSFYSSDPTVQKEQIELAQKERQALELMRAISWNIEATKMLNGGGLLTSPTGKSFPKQRDGRVLDLGGQASCDWAWEVALQYPHSDVYTVFTNDQRPTMDMEGPENHHTQVVPNLWTLPYPSNHFDIVSARSLYSNLKTEKPLGKKLDEYDLCLRECVRCLKPGGYLEFSLLDADIMRAQHQASALSVEFCFSLRTRGYDPYPTKSFLPRLRRAGFREMKRAWLALPITQVHTRPQRRMSFDADDLLPRPSIEEVSISSNDDEVKGSTADASFIAGLVGAWAWERWMLKLQLEMGKEEDRLLEGVAAALEEGANSGGAWRYLSGWARKPFSSSI